MTAVVLAAGHPDGVGAERHLVGGVLERDPLDRAPVRVSTRRMARSAGVATQAVRPSG